MRLLPILAGIAALSACATRAQAQPVETLRIGMPDDPDILDPTFSRTFVGTVVMTALCDKLFDFDAKLNIVPVLATGYEWTDSKTLQIRLRPDVQFQNGEPFNADAVRYTLERHLSIRRDSVWYDRCDRQQVRLGFRHGSAFPSWASPAPDWGEPTTSAARPQAVIRADPQPAGPGDDPR